MGAVEITMRKYFPRTHNERESLPRQVVFLYNIDLVSCNNGFNDVKIKFEQCILEEFFTPILVVLKGNKMTALA